MSGVEVTPVPADRDGRPIHVLHGDTVQRYSIIEARLLQVKLDKALDKLDELTGGAMTPPQRRQLHALLKERRGASGGERFPVLSEILDREITSTNDLTRAEASRVIDVLLAVRPLQPREARS